MPVTVTEIAARRIEQIIQEHGFDPASMKLRVGVKGGGCSGFNYTLDLTEVQKDSDESWNFTYARGASASANEGGGTASALLVLGRGARGVLLRSGLTAG